MLNLLKYAVFALGLLAAYVLFEYFVLNKQPLSDTVNRAENAIVTKVQNVSNNVNDKYIQPAKVKEENVE